MQNNPATASEHDVFISYQRNYEFRIIDELAEQLRAHNLQVWVDRDGIRAEPWGTSITKAIEQARVVLFLVSKESLESEVCHLELAYARRLQKKILIFSFASNYNSAVNNANYKKINVPAGKYLGLKDAVSGQENFDSISPINLITLPTLDKTTYNQGLHRLIEAIRGDLEYERNANYYLNQALRWERNERDLLGEIELEQANQWLDQAPVLGKAVYAITLELIKQSGQEQSRQQLEKIKRQKRVTQILIGTVIIAVIVAIIIAGLGIFAETQRQEADYQRNQANIASTEVVKQLNQTQSILQTQAINERTQRIELGENTSQPTLSSAFIWLSFNDSNRVRQYRTDTGEPTETVIPTGDNPQQPIAVDKYIWVASDDRVTRIDATLNPESQNLPIENGVQQIHVNEDWLWVTTNSPKQLQIYDTETLTLIAANPLSLNENVQSIGQNFAWLLDNQRLIRYRAQDGSSSEATLTFTPTDNLSVTDTHVWLVDDVVGTVAIYDIQTISPIRDPINVGRRTSFVTDDGQYIWTFSPVDNLLTQFDRQTADQIRSITVPASLQRIYREGTHIWVFTTEGTYTYDVTTGSQVSTSQDIQGVSQNNPTHDVRNLWVANPVSDNILAIDLAEASVNHVIRNCVTPSAPLFDDASVWVLCNGTDTLLKIPAMITFHQLGTLGRSISPQQPHIEENTAWILMENENQIALIDIETGLLVDDLELDTHDTVDEKSTVMFGDEFIWILRGDNMQVLLIDPVTQSVRIDNVGAYVHQITAINDTIWINGVSREGEDLFIYDRHTGNLLKKHNVGMTASEPVYDAEQDAVWVAGTTFVGSLFRINAQTLEIEEPVVQVGGVPASLRIQGDSVWLTSIFSEFGWDVIYQAYEGGFRGEVYRVRRSDSEILSKVEVNEFPRDAIFAGGLVWLSQTQFLGDHDNSISAFNPTTLDVKIAFDLCNHPAPPFYDAETQLIWYTCTNIDEGDVGDVMVIDTESLEVVQHYKGLGLSGWEPVRIGNTVWIVYQSSANLVVFDAYSGDILQLLAIGNQSTPLTQAGDGTVWLANRDDSTVQQVIAEPVYQVSP